jgi:uncharacterized membrane protein
MANPPEKGPPTEPGDDEEGDAPSKRARPGRSLTKISWEGPIPPPAAFRGYDEIIENGAERLFAQFESETRHRHLIQRRSQTYPFAVQAMSYACALIVALAILGVAVYAISQKAFWIAGLFGTGVLGVVVTAFIRHGLPNARAGRGDQRNT